MSLVSSRRLVTLRTSVFLLLGAANLFAEEFPDISSSPADLEVPALSEGAPAAGKRVKQGLHVLYLPQDWKSGSRMPVLVEFAGNKYAGKYGDISAGTPEGSNLGYGLSGGRGYLWLCVPFLRAAGDEVAVNWWGDAPTYDPQPTLKYLRETLKTVCRDYGGDETKVILCGFSRGAIACNFMGLYDDETAKLWRGFFAYSHYDGSRAWVTGSERESVLARLRRLGTRPQFICGEGTNAQETEKYISPLLPEGDLTFAGTGFRNHNDAWALRPCAAREQARRWLAKAVASP